MPDMLSLRYGFKYVNNDLIAITACIADCMQNTLELSNWQEANRKQMAALQKFLKQKLAREYAIAGEIREHLENNLDLKFEDNDFGDFVPAPEAAESYAGFEQADRYHHRMAFPPPVLLRMP